MSKLIGIPTVDIDINGNIDLVNVEVESHCDSCDDFRSYKGVVALYPKTETSYQGFAPIDCEKCDVSKEVAVVLELKVKVVD